MVYPSLAQLLIAVALVATTSFCKLDANRIREVVDDDLGEQREFDYFNLALQWPGSICQHTSHCCSSNACCRGSNAPTEFTIHGLWPDYNDGTWPACCKQSNFDEKEISTLLDALEKYWPSYSCGSSSTCHGTKGSFWAHEVEKHGTCSLTVVRDEYSYFLTTLNVYFKYNVTRVLNEAGYLPSNTEKYPLGGIVSAIQNAFHATPKLVCSKGAVKELHLCFFKDFKPRDCIIENENYSSRSSCPKYVSLPAYVPSAAVDHVAVRRH
ncbi:Ribonuclease [Melia azedarach]|uniref:Ribonuclease n=1 Tax=Melia azedarach TaxID=155640 RepID=A0ACC1Z451_MELAZ|nr:Ribonuclease [Melia azedarach]